MRRRDRQPARHAHGAERVHRLFAARADEGRRSIRGRSPIATFALCGFANFCSIGIQIGGIGALAPTRRHDLARLGLRAMMAGTLANFVTATIAGVACCDRRDRPPTIAVAEAAALHPGARARQVPEVAVVLGSGLGDYADDARRTRCRCQYEDIPHWPVASVDRPRREAGGRQRRAAAARVCALSGRVHFYEGTTCAP